MQYEFTFMSPGEVIDWLYNDIHMMGKVVSNMIDHTASQERHGKQGAGPHQAV